MSNNIYDILKNYVNNTNDPEYYFLYTKFCKNMNIDDNTYFKYIQDGGLKYFKKINDDIYSFDYFINENEDNSVMFVKMSDPNLNNKYCVSASYYNKDTFKIDIIENPQFCLESKNIKQDFNKVIKYGDVMIKMLIKFAKDNNFKYIEGRDESEYFCVKNMKSFIKFRLELKYTHVLSTGIPWYYKYGFKYKNKDDDEIVKFNKNILDNLNLQNINIHKIVMRIIEIKDDELFKQYNLKTDNKIDIINTIYEILQFYNDCLNENKSIYYFFDVLFKNYCIIMSYIYIFIYKDLGLKPIYKKDMILKL